MHSKYYLDDGKTIEVPSVTQILGIINKPYLVNWAYKIGKDGKNLNKVREDATTIGSMVHAMIEADLKNIAHPSADELDAEQLAEVFASYDQYLAWKSNYPNYKLVFSEESMVSQISKYGGTIDALFRSDNEYIMLISKHPLRYRLNIGFS